MKNVTKEIQDLIQVNEDLENYFANTIIPQLFVDEELILRKYTPPAMKQFNLNEDLIGKPLENIKENFRFPTIIDNIRTVMGTGKLLEKEIQTTDRRWYKMNIIPYLLRKENKVNGVIITFIDITSRILDLKEQEKMMAEYELLLDSLAHDIKNPILVMKLSLEYIQKIQRDDFRKLAKLALNLQKGLLNIENVVNSMLDSRWQQQRYQASAELLDLGNILEDVRLSVAPLVQESGAVISTDLKVREITFVRRKLRSILYNLLSNAIKYTPKDRRPEIKISIEPSGDYILIKVEDNGAGMDSQAIAHIFEKFKRFKTDVEGAGVGLYLVNTIVSSAQGKIEIDSKVSGGSVFSVFIKNVN
ncbi:sensor histidine kinase [Pedobacter sp. GSP4]|uniref:sensor histidine kinase n=1 Tax=Pedobacter sp. GSP4 TaxID=3453716 RepID=UPI003EE9C56A